MEDIEQNEILGMRALESLIHMEQKDMQEKLLLHALPADRTVQNALAVCSQEELEELRYNLYVYEDEKQEREELAASIAPAVVKFARTWFLSMIEEQYRFFQQLIAQGGMTTDIPVVDMRIGYLNRVGLLMPGNLNGQLAWYMPDELQQVFREMDHEDLAASIAFNTKVLRLAAGVIQYAGFMEHRRLFDEVSYFIDDPSGGEMQYIDFMGTIINGSCWYNRIHMNDYGAYHYAIMDPDLFVDMQYSHTDLEYLELTAEQAWAAGADGYIAKPAEYHALRQFLLEKHAYTEKRADQVLCEITILLQNYADIQPVLRYAYAIGLMKTAAKTRQLESLLADYRENLPLWQLKGHTIRELPVTEDA